MNNIREPIESYDITIEHDWGHLSLDVEEDQNGEVCKTSEVRQLEQEHQEAIEVLDEACTMICELCVRLNPQHKDCTSCDDLDYLREPILKAKGE